MPASTNSSQQIAVIGNDPVVRFAAKELQRYLRLATGKSLPVRSAKATDAAGPGFVLGMLCDFREAPAQEPGDLNDHVRVTPLIKNKKLSGYKLSGVNPRSVLFAVYQYLQAIGFAWVRPGKRGEIIPKLKSAVTTSAGTIGKKGRPVKIDHKPSYKFRTICIEGACSREHLLDLIDWQAKRMMNGYFIQFEWGACFIKAWYTRPGPDNKPVGTIDMPRVRQIVGDVISAVKKRGMSFERVGHGWTTACLGLPGESWETLENSALSEDKKSWLAMLDGKREFFRGVPLNTNLDYARKDIRSAVVDTIVKYAQEHGDIDLLHFWLADGSNNHDEKLPELPSDYFVDMLNELDEKLSEKGLATRIVFLMYADLLWAPKRAKIQKPDRFILMFAPISRSYLTSFTEARMGDEKPQEFVLNKLKLPKSVAVNLKYLADWQKLFAGDSFDFDYHAIWACYYDPSMWTISQTLHKDIVGFDALGIQGLNSCQNQRMSFPHNLLMDVMADTLWDKRQSFAKIANRSFGTAFGKDAAKAQAFIKKMSSLWLPMFDPLYIPAPDEKRVAQCRKNIPQMKKLIAGFAPVVKANLKRFAAEPRGAVATSWFYAEKYLQLLGVLLPMFEAYVARDPSVRQHFEKVDLWLRKNEAAIHPALDVYCFRKVLTWRVNELEALLKESAAQAVTLAGQ
jgi:hypothetical protein